MDNDLAADRWSADKKDRDKIIPQETIQPAIFLGMLHLAVVLTGKYFPYETVSIKN